VVTPTGDRYVSTVITDKLLARQLVIKDNHGVLNAESLPELERFISEYGMCDFCSSSEAPHTLVIPDFTMTDAVGSHIGNSTGGWACCDECYALVKADQRQELLDRSQKLLGGGKYGAGAIKILHTQFWGVWDTLHEAAGVSSVLVDFVNDKLASFPHPDPPPDDRSRRLAAIQRFTGLTTDEMAALMRGELAYQQVSQKLVAAKRRFSPTEATKLLESIMRTNAPMPPGQTPHWQVALDMKYAAIKRLQKALAATNPSVFFPEAVDVNDRQAVRKMVMQAEQITELQHLGYADDIKHLTLAATYSFNADTMDAIRLGANSIPHESPLSSVETPYQTAGFFWFAEPFPITSSPVVSDKTNALLWGWEDGNTLRLTTFVIENGELSPSTKWVWPRHLTFHEMIGLNTAGHRRMYGPGGEYAHLPYLVGEETTMKCVAEMSLFFLMSCVWFKQRVLVSAPGHVERHARKRYQKEHKLKEPPTVQVIALRQSTKAPKEPGDPMLEPTEHRRYDKWRWVVDGHNRLQPCGSGLKDRKLIWIAPFVKGHGDAPLKPKATKVYAVIR
jgi:hypothetical protein